MQNSPKNPSRQALRLGLVGDQIAQSQSPRFYALAGAHGGVDVTFDRLQPREQGLTFHALFDCLADRGYRGVSVTYPYKEQAMTRVHVEDAAVRAIGAVNTVLFEDGQALGYNTDYSGFMAAYRKTRPGNAPGATLLIGAGGAGRATAFGLARLGATQIRLADRDIDKADSLASALRAEFPGLALEIGTEPAMLAPGAQGIVNCIPVGMTGHPGTPLPATEMKTAQWVFDAVYTPADTQLLQAAQSLGLAVIPGIEMFFHQAVEAWRLYSGRPVDPSKLRSLFFGNA